MTGGTENSASTKMVKALGVNPGDAGEGDDPTGSASEVPAKNTAASEGTKKSLDSMFNAMAPLQRNKGQDSDSEGEGGKKRRKTTRKDTADEPGEDDEALLLHYWFKTNIASICAHMYPRAPIVSENICRPKLRRPN